jgi:hypothetical protein
MTQFRAAVAIFPSKKIRFAQSNSVDFRNEGSSFKNESISLQPLSSRGHEAKGCACCAALLPDVRN